MKRLKELNIRLERLLVRISRFIAQIRAVLVILIIIGIISFYVWGFRSSDIELFPFDSMRWGEVSSWLSLLITMISIAFIYSTFRLQQKITFIEDRKYRFGLLPNPELEEVAFKPLDEDYTLCQQPKNEIIIDEKFVLRIKLGTSFFVNAQLMAEDKKILVNRYEHNKNDDGYYLALEHNFFSGQKVGPIDGKANKAPASYRHLTLRIEDRDNVLSDIHFRIRLFIDKGKNGKAQAKIDKLTKLNYRLAVGINYPKNKLN